MPPAPGVVAVPRPKHENMPQSRRPAADRGHDPYAPFRFADFRRYMLAGTILTVGGQMQSVAVGWELYERTRSATALGLVGLAQVVPVILLAIPAGHVADRYNRKHQLLAAYVLFAVTSVGLATLSALR